MKLVLLRDGVPPTVLVENLGEVRDVPPAPGFGPAPPLDLPMHQRAAVEEQAVVHVGVLQALHLAEEALSGILVGADDIGICDR